MNMPESIRIGHLKIKLVESDRDAKANLERWIDASPDE
jgi:hypothetical protein